MFFFSLCDPDPDNNQPAGKITDENGNLINDPDQAKLNTQAKRFTDLTAPVATENPKGP